MFVAELLEGRGPELTVIDRTLDEADARSRWGRSRRRCRQPTPAPPTPKSTDLPVPTAALAAARRVMPLPTARERRLALRLRAAELVGLLEATAAEDPEADDARARSSSSWWTSAGPPRCPPTRPGPPASTRSPSGPSRSTAGAGANLLSVAPVPGHFSYTQPVPRTRRVRCGTPSAYVYRIPEPDRPVAAFAFGSTAHATFEAFTRERRERIARGRADAHARGPRERTSRPTGTRRPSATPPRRPATSAASTACWTTSGTASSRAVGEAIHEEQDFELVLEPDDGSAPVRIYGSIDRIDRTAVRRHRGHRLQDRPQSAARRAWTRTSS